MGSVWLHLLVIFLAKSFCAPSTEFTYPNSSIFLSSLYVANVESRDNPMCANMPSLPLTNAPTLCWSNHHSYLEYITFASCYEQWFALTLDSIGADICYLHETRIQGPSQVTKTSPTNKDTVYYLRRSGDTEAEASGRAGVGIAWVIKLMLVS